MGIEIPHEIEIRLAEEARKEGISMEALLERLMSERESADHFASNGSPPRVPILNLGAMGLLHRRDINDDAR